MNATQEFSATIEQCRTLATQIQQVIDDHLDVNPDSVNWGNVADAVRLQADLLRITEWLNP